MHFEIETDWIASETNRPVTRRVGKLVLKNEYYEEITSINLYDLWEAFEFLDLVKE